MPRSATATRSCPGSRPVWSGWGIALGLHSAAPSTAYSAVNAAPSRIFLAGLRWSPLSVENATESAWAFRASVRWSTPPVKDVTMRGAAIWACLLYTSDAADDLLCVDLG